LAGLKGQARRLAAALLDRYEPWPESAVATLRAYVRSVERLEALETAPEVDARAVQREARTCLLLLRGLHLDGV
jgi:hypothetical protein